jgi:hypothetical protein
MPALTVWEEGKFRVWDEWTNFRVWRFWASRKKSHTGKHFDYGWVDDSVF